MLLLNLRVSEGKIINAASSDLIVLDYGHTFVLQVLFEPFVEVVHLILMYLLIGVEVFYGFLLIVAIILSQFLTGKCITALRDKGALYTDQRLKLLYDMVSGIRTIKAYGWELELEKKVNKIRAKEKNLILMLNFVRSSTSHILRYCGFFSALLVYYVKSQNG